MDLSANERLGPTATASAPTVETSASAVSWSAIIAGAVVATAVSLTLFALAAGLGLAAAPAWPNSGGSLKEFSITTAIAFIVVQWISACFGGYITGRLRTKWTRTHTHEVFFRDTAHGFITWALSTLIIAVLLTSAVAGAKNPVEAGDISDAARQASAAASIFTSLSMVVGAFIASISAALGGRLRDEHP